MKSKGGSLYEVLKSASRPSGQDPGAPAAPDTTPAVDGNQGTLQERLSAYKAAKLAAVSQPSPEAPAAAAATPRVSATTLVLEPDPTPLPASTVIRAETPVSVAAPTRMEAEPAAAPPSAGPGERVVKLTYNTALFGGMVAVGLMFIAYAVGLHVGKGSVAAEAAVVEPPRPVAPIAVPVLPPKPVALPVVVPPAAKKEYTIRLCEMKISTSQERLKALAFAEDAELKRALERAGRKGYEQVKINRGGEPKLALFVDKFTDINSDAAKSALTAMKTFRWKNATPFSGAVFEEK
jgi:hypothetical protein